MLVNSCLIPVAQANGVSVVTIEGMSAHNLMKPLQEAFLQCGGAQCGICTPGMILAAVHLLEKKPEPALADIQEGLRGIFAAAPVTCRFSKRLPTRRAKELHNESRSRRYKLASPDNLQAVLSLLAGGPTQWLPIAGGTDVMVLYSAGKLANRNLINIWNIPELRQIGFFPDAIRIGAACTYTALRQHEIVSQEFPLLATAASWTGGIANQNRGTLGGNIANASPAADSLPALLVYDAELTLVSVRGERRVDYRSFHTGYKQTVLASDELIRDISLRAASPDIFRMRGRLEPATLKRFPRFASPRWARSQTARFAMCASRWAALPPFRCV